jgi:hypothetical protein
MRARFEDSDAPKLIAYQVSRGSPMRLATAYRDRQWMDSTPGKFANRCLPLRIANQAGWFILNAHALRVTWNGSDHPSDLTIEALDGESIGLASSHFGSGILTWNIPFLFRTPSGYNLHVRGPANWPKDGAYPLEGIVETDWAVSTFTMNWKLTCADLPVVFDVDEPICMVVPQRRGELEAFRPEIRELDEEPETASAFRQWAESRAKFNQDLKVGGSEAVKTGWQKDYVRGTTLGGLRAEEHQTKLKLKGFSGG